MARPTYTAYVVNDAKTDGGKAQWREVGAVWPNQNGKGMTLVIYEQISVSGRIVLMPPKEESSAAPAEGD